MKFFLMAICCIALSVPALAATTVADESVVYDMYGRGATPVAAVEAGVNAYAQATAYAQSDPDIVSMSITYSDYYQLGDGSWEYFAEVTVVFVETAPDPLPPIPGLEPPDLLP